MIRVKIDYRGYTELGLYVRHNHISTRYVMNYYLNDICLDICHILMNDLATILNLVSCTLSNIFGNIELGVRPSGDLSDFAFYDNHSSITCYRQFDTLSDINFFGLKMFERNNL